MKNLQLNVKEALELCRYEWMQRALEAFLRVMQEEEGGKQRTKEETMQDNSSRQRRIDDVRFKLKYVSVFLILA